MARGREESSCDRPRRGSSSHSLSEQVPSAWSIVGNGLTRLVRPEIGRSSGHIIVDVRKTNSCINGFGSGTETKIEVRRLVQLAGIRWIGGRHLLKHIVVHENAVSV